MVKLSSRERVKKTISKLRNYQILSVKKKSCKDQHPSVRVGNLLGRCQGGLLENGSMLFEDSRKTIITSAVKGVKIVDEATVLIETINSVYELKVEKC